MPKEIEIQKGTVGDKEVQLRNAVQKQIEEVKQRSRGEYCDYFYCYMKDWDENYVYVRSKGEDYRYAYTMTEAMQVTIDLDSETEGDLIIESKFSPKGESSLEKSILKTLNKFFGGSQREVPPEVVSEEILVIKQFDEEEMISYEPLYTPPDTADGHGDAMTEEEIVKAVDQINNLISEGVALENLNHAAPIKNAWKYQEAFVSPWPECTVGDTVIKKGQPVLIVKYNNQRAWELRKEGRIKGPSLGAGAIRTEVSE